VLASLDVATPWCGDAVSPLYSAAGGAIGTIQEQNGCGDKTFTINGLEGPALYEIYIDACSCADAVSVTQLSTNQVIGGIQITHGCCDGGRFVVTYPQELPLDHKLLLIVTMCMMHMRRDRDRQRRS
jgi:hypothetical protein